MCGIWFYLGKGGAKLPVAPAVDALYPRGPEDAAHLDVGSGAGAIGKMIFTRLAINGLNKSGMQPFSAGPVHWMCNGEIYNWRDLADQYAIPTVSGSDCEIIGPLYKTLDYQEVPLAELFRSFDGVFATVIVDEAKGRVLVARDPYGVRPLYVGERPDGLIFASEMKALMPYGCSSIRPFPPGTYEEYVGGQKVATVKYHAVPWVKGAHAVRGEWTSLVRRTLQAAVRKRMLSERPVAALLSGGIDSSLVAALAAEELRNTGQPPLHTFSIGFEGSSDLAYARKVAAWIGSKHHEVVLTPQDFFEAIPTVIKAIESFDTTTVRASVGNYLVGKAIREQSDCKVVLNGDGSDELWGSYLYFYKAPSDAAFEAESERLLDEIHMFDVLRSDRCISAHGLEPRTPFLDKAFVAAARAAPTTQRRPSERRVEKDLLRGAFRNTATLPDDVLERRKEAFSDGVSGKEKSWYELAQEMASAKVPANWQELAGRFAGPAPVPTTAEQYYYRTVYESFYPGTASVNVPHFWLPRWCEGATDPSARTLAVYAESPKS